ncbi:MAG: tetratricopeptide repeat protein [Candidatus Obscuribacterales bacterium]|nr:tetratricopeptide repeat protein [Candidatus Obscuribacterales bacterium]
MKTAKIVENAQKLLEQGQFTEAIESLSTVLESDPDCVDAYLVRALASRKCGLMEASLSDYNKFIANDSTRGDAFYGRGFVHIKLGGYESAINDFSRVIELQPTEIGAYINRGNAKCKAGRPADAIQDYEAALKLDSSDHHARIGLAHAYDEQGECERAIDAYTYYLKIDSQNVDALFRRGLNFAKLTKHSEAARDFSRVLELDPEHKQAAEQRTKAYEQLSEHRDLPTEIDKVPTVAVVPKVTLPEVPKASVAVPPVAPASLERYLSAAGSMSVFVQLPHGQYSMFVIEYLSKGGNAGYVTYLAPGSWFPPRRRAGEGDLFSSLSEALSSARKHGEPILKTVWLPAGEHLISTARETWANALGVENDARTFPSQESAVLHGVRKELLKAASLARLAGYAPKSPHYFDLHEVNLVDADFRGLNVSAIRFDQSDLSNSIFIESTATKSSFKKSQLRNADFSAAKADDANFLEADMQNFVSVKGSFKGADFTQADLRGAKFEKADLQQANFQKARLDNTLFKACAVNEKTVLPPKKEGYCGLVWKGVGRNPFTGDGYGRTGADCQNLEDLLTSLQMELDSGRLKKAVAMLKSEPLQLFADIETDHFYGIVRSQTDESLVYCCYLAHSGTYYCCTQNLNVCGGQGDSVCKHLLSVLIGLAASGKLSWAEAACRIEKCGRYEPADIDKESVAALFKKYKRAEFGQVLWDPIETNPQDYK